MDGHSTPPAITPQRSTHLLLFITFTHAGAMAAAGLSGVSGWNMLLASAGLLLSWVVNVRRWRDGAWSAAGTLRISADGTWLEEGPGGPVRHWQVLPPLYLHPALIVVRLRALDAQLPDRALVLAPDSLPADDARRLRAWLRLHHGSA